MPLVPGVVVFQGLLEIVHTGTIQGDAPGAGQSLASAAIIGIGLAAGASLGIYLGRSVRATLSGVPRVRARLRR